MKRFFSALMYTSIDSFLIFEVQNDSIFNLNQNKTLGNYTANDGVKAFNDINCSVLNQLHF